MSKKQKKPATPKKARAAVRFAVGAQVRVKPGTTDPDFSDFPLGGWAGTIREVDPRHPATYLIEWNEHTRNHMHPHPEGPPMSPLTRSYFTNRAFFDVRFGPGRSWI